MIDKMVNFSYKKALALCIIWGVPNFLLLVLSPHPFGQFSKYDGRDYGSFYPFISSEDYNGKASGIFPNRIEQYDFTEFLVYALVPLALLMAIKLWFSPGSRNLDDLKENVISGVQSSESSEMKDSAGIAGVRKPGLSRRSLIKKIFYISLIVISIGMAILTKMIRDEERKSALRRTLQKAWIDSKVFPTAPLPPEYDPVDFSSVVFPQSVAGLELYSPVGIKRVEAEIEEDRRDKISELELYKGEMEDGYLSVSRFRFIKEISDIDGFLVAETDRKVDQFRSWVETEDVVREVDDCNIEGVDGVLCRLTADSKGVPVKLYFMTMVRGQVCWRVGVSSVNAENDLMMDRVLKSVRVSEP